LRGLLLLLLRQEAGMAGRRLEALTLTEAERSELTALAARPKTARAKTARALARRARIILTCAGGLENEVVSREPGVHAGSSAQRF
jgi:hypothetical protein